MSRTGDDLEVLCSIASAQDARIGHYLATRQRTHFWYAGCLDASVPRMHELGFDNYPLLGVPHEKTLFLFERVMGCNLRTVGSGAVTTFNTWCEPVIVEPRDVHRLSPKLTCSAAWDSYERALAACRHSSGACADIPAPMLSFSPLDCACNLCSAEKLFTWIHDAEDVVAALLDLLCDLYLEARAQVARMGLETRNLFGFPCVYCNDLQLANVSPATIKRLVLPRYERVARECGGMILALHSNDLNIVERVTRSDGFLGCLFDRRLPLGDIRRVIGKTLFVLMNSPYDDSLDRPTWRDGMYWNPIVQSYNRELDEVYGELAGECSMILHISRPRLDQVCRERARLLRP